jgi:ADP-ribose pyrophosphatase YjhB (NUDIX family)
MMTEPTAIPPPRILHGTLLVLREQGRLHLIRRTKEPYKELLALPGGKMEQGETPLEAARREMFEETGLMRPKPEWIGRATDLLIDGAPPHDLFILDVFDVQLSEGTVAQPSFEGTIERVPIDRLQERSREIIPADLEILFAFVARKEKTLLDMMTVKRGGRYEVTVLWNDKV